MVLKGNLEDFNLTNILQIISMEKKSGDLNVTQNDEKGKISFLKGKVIYAERNYKNDEDRLKDCLVRNNYILEMSWKKACKERAKTLKSIWEILRSYAPKDILKQMIQRQIKDVVFSLLRWRNGKYEFISQESLNLSKELITPIDMEFLLMEGCRIADEWSEIEKNLPPPETRVRKNISDNTDMEEDEKAILSSIKEDATIIDLINSSLKGEFESYEIIARLISSNRLVIVDETPKRRISINIRKKFRLLMGIITIIPLLLLNIWGIYNQLDNRGKGDIDFILIREANREMNKIYENIQLYYLINHDYPGSIENLTQSGLIDTSYSIDPWNRKYQYELKNSYFTLYSLGPDEKEDGDNLFYKPH